MQIEIQSGEGKRHLNLHMNSAALLFTGLKGPDEP